jgi:hypothetical protein
VIPSTEATFFGGPAKRDNEVESSNAKATRLYFLAIPELVPRFGWIQAFSRHLSARILVRCKSDTSVFYCAKSA